VTAWHASTLGDLETKSGGVIQTGPFGSQLHMSDYSDHGVPVIMPTNIRDLRVDPIGVARVSEDHVVRLSRHKLEAGDIVYSRRGDVEKCALITERETGWLCGTGCLLVRVQGPGVDSRFLAYSLSLAETRAWISQRAVGATMPNLNTSILREVPVLLPPVAEQRGIAATLGALDDKIKSNRRLRDLLRAVGQARVNAALFAAPLRTLTLGELTTSIARGVAPKYADDDPTAPLVLNQRCVRGGWVTASHARHMVDRNVASSKRVSDGDILVNSTGTGTLGRVGRWHSGSIFADGHVSVVKTDTAITDPTVLAYALFGREADIEAMATGSTGQTELNPTRLASLVVELPDRTVSAELEPVLAIVEEKIDALRAEDARLSETRDTLLPELLSGRIRVPEAAEAIEEVNA
jgi:type I restriction enzyme S subunit